MRALLTLALLLMGMVSVAAEGATPNLKGTWFGTFKSLVYGNNPHHPGTQTTNDPPQVREVKFTYDIEGQDGRLLWGKSWSNPERKEPFALTLAANRRSASGVDTDGHHQLRILSANRLEVCYHHTGLGPTKSIVASCGILDRMKQ